MNVQIVDILDEDNVKVEVGKNQFIAEWDGDKPEINKIYSVEMDIYDELIWKTNIRFTTEDDDMIVQEPSSTKIVARLDYAIETDLAALRVYDSIVLVDVTGIEQDIIDEWVVINCHSIRLSDINL